MLNRVYLSDKVWTKCIENIEKYYDRHHLLNAGTLLIWTNCILFTKSIELWGPCIWDILLIKSYIDHME